MDPGRMEGSKIIGEKKANEIDRWPFENVLHENETPKVGIAAITQLTISNI